MLSEINQAEKEISCMISLICGMPKSETHKSRERDGVTRCRGRGIRDVLFNCISFNYQVNRSQRPNAQRGDYRHQYYIMKVNLVKSLNLYYFIHKNK